MQETSECLSTDRILFRQLLQNLLTNALQYTRTGGVTVRREPEALAIRVTDTGVGIPAGEIARVFDEYYRVPTPGNRPRGPALDRPGLAKPAVLVVEDDAAVRDALKLLLSLDGYPTWVAESAAGAEELFALHGAEIDVVISDYQLGNGRNGVELVESLRTVAGRDLPAVILSGDTSPVLASIHTVSRVVLLRKPVNARQLILKLEELFGAAG
jgi:hypothetical protein